MNTRIITKRSLKPRAISSAVVLALSASVFLSGCGRDEISSYRTAKEPVKIAHAPHAPHDNHDGHDHGSTPSPKDWKIPSGWQTTAPGPMVLASYNTSTKEGSPTVTVSMFPGDVGGVLANVNRWRGQLGQAPTTEADLPKLIQPIELPHAQGTLVDFAGTNPKTSQPSRMIGVIVPRDGNSWFYKMMGDPETLTTEKPRFIEFIGHAH